MGNGCHGDKIQVLTCSQHLDAKILIFVSEGLRSPNPYPMVDTNPDEVHDGTGDITMFLFICITECRCIVVIDHGDTVDAIADHVLLEFVDHVIC